MLFSKITDKYRYITQNAKLHHKSLKNNIDKVKSILVRKNLIRLDLHLYLNTHQRQRNFSDSSIWFTEYIV